MGRIPSGLRTGRTILKLKGDNLGLDEHIVYEAVSYIPVTGKLNLSLYLRYWACADFQPVVQVVIYKEKRIKNKNTLYELTMEDSKWKWSKFIA